MMNKYMLGQKYKIFPEFRTMDNDDIQAYKDRVAHKNPDTLSYRDWFWHHPSAYKLIYYGVIILAYLNFGGGFIFCLFKGWKLGSFITFLMLLAVVRYHYVQSKVPYFEGTTFYKMWMEDDYIV